MVHSVFMEFTWSKMYSVNVGEIDAEHERMFGLILEVNCAVNASEDGDKKIKKVFDDLIGHTKIHFATEEKYFDMFKYSRAVEHKREHKYFLDKLAGLKGRHYEGDKEAAAELSVFLEDWLTNHIKYSDMLYVSCFKEFGL